MQDLGHKPIVIGDSAPVPVKKPIMVNDHEASSSKGVKKIFQPKWCPSGLTHTQKRKLQRLRNKEKREQEAEKLRDEYFNKYRPMIPQTKTWRVVQLVGGGD